MKSEAGRESISVFRYAAALLVWSAVACGGDGGDGDGGGGPDGGDGDGGGPDGSVAPATDYVANTAGLISLIEGPANWTVSAQSLYARMTDALEVPPASLLASAGECEIWVHPGPVLCDPPCGDQACVGQDMCAPFPAPVSAGEIAVSGLLEPLRFLPAQGGYLADRQFPGEDLFADGAAIAAVAPGADVPGFALEVTGVVPLEADLDLESGGVLRVQDGVDEVIGWTAETSGRIQLGLAVGHHGSPYQALLVCESEDDGELVVPGDLISQLPRYTGGLESHTSWLARFDRDAVDTAAGPVVFEVSSTAIIYAVARD